MLAVVFILCLVRVTSAYDLRCSEQTHASASFRPADDGVEGRYIAHVCMEMKPNVTNWSIDLMYKKNVRYCNNTHHGLRPGATHSTFNTPAIAAELKNLNCNHVCIRTAFEMVFSSCYHLKTMLSTDKTFLAPFDTYYNITNNYTFEYFSAETQTVTFYHEKDTTVSFYGHAPMIDIIVELFKDNSSIGVVTDNCTAQAHYTQLLCTLWLEEGCYNIVLDRRAPWFSGVFGDYAIVKYSFCRTGSAPRSVEEGGAALWWCCGAALLAALCAALAWRARDHTHLHKRVLHYWTQHSSRSGVEAGETAREEKRRVLLLYAREGELGQRLVDALKSLLQQHNLQVQDLFSPECVRAASLAPHSWIANNMQTAHVVLIQTPALKALYSPGDGQTEPLLGAIYRTPHFGDTLLQYALRLLQDGACRPNAYRQYYLATLCAVPTDVLTQVVPFRRYLLPGAAYALVQDLGGIGTEEEGEGALANLAHAAEALAQHIADNPHYLDDELLIT